MSVTPDPHAIAMMVLTVFALYLFTRDSIPLELSSLGLIAVLATGFALFPYPGVEPVDFFSGFAHEALIAVCALMVLGRAWCAPARWNRSGECSAGSGDALRFSPFSPPC